MTPIVKQIRSFRQISYLNTPSDLVIGHTTNKARINDSRVLHAKAYMKRGYVQKADINDHGHINEENDPYYAHSAYFAASERNGTRRVIATARQIHDNGKDGHESFPTIKELELYPDMKEAIMALDANKCVEISGLAKVSGASSSAVMALYRSMWHHSLRRKHHVWLMACDLKAFERLKYLFGDALVRIGDDSYYMGSHVVPAMLEVHRSVDALMQESRTLNPLKRRMKRELVRFFMTGLSIKFKHITKAAVPSREIIKAMEERI